MNVYTTSDMYLASAIVLRTGIFPELETERSGWTIFRFNGTGDGLPDIQEAVDYYGQNGNVGCLRYAEILKELRTAVIQRKVTKREGGFNYGYGRRT